MSCMSLSFFRFRGSQERITRPTEARDPRSLVNQKLKCFMVLLHWVKIVYVFVDIFVFGLLNVYESMSID